jgi:hypothetical protein
VGLKSLKSLNLTNGYPNSNNNNNKVKSKPLELFAGTRHGTDHAVYFLMFFMCKTIYQPAHTRQCANFVVEFF